jgi:hypothetical protein
MTNPKLTYILGIIDHSGSMATIASDTQGGWNAFIEDQASKPGECRVSLVEFDSYYDVVYANQPIHSVSPYTLRPRGSTALLDAIGRSVTELGKFLSELPERERPGSVNVVVLTDGYENASREWSPSRIKSLITQQQNVYNWDFTFLGANQDAVLTGTDYGFRADKSLTYAGEHVWNAFQSTSNSVGNYRGAVASGATYDSAIASSVFTDEDREDAVGTNK